MKHKYDKPLDGLVYLSSFSTFLLGGAAYVGGLRQYDRLLEVNGIDVQGMKHGQVVDLVIQAGDHLRLRILRVSEAEATRLQRLEEPENAAKFAPVSSVQLHSDVNVVWFSLHVMLFVTTK